MNPGDPTISGVIKVRDVFAEQGKEAWECQNQRVVLYIVTHSAVSVNAYDPQVYDGLINVNTGVWHINSWTGGQQLDWTPADAAKVTNLMTIAPQTTKKVNLVGQWSSATQGKCRSSHSP